MDNLGGLPDLAGIGPFNMVIDTETTGLDPLDDKPFLVAMSIDEVEHAIPWTESAVKVLTYAMLKAKRVGVFNGKFDLHQIINGGVDPWHIMMVNWYDAQLAEQLIDEHQHEYSLEGVARKYGVKHFPERYHQEIADRMGCKPDKDAMRYMSKMPIEFAARKSKEDVLATRLVIDKQLPIIAQQELERVLNLEMKVLPVLVLMEREGVPVDPEALNRAQGELRTLVDELDEEITRVVGYRVNVNSTHDMQYAFHALGLPEDPSGSFAKAVLDAVDHPFCRLALEMRTVLKAKDTFVEGNRRWVRADGRIHTTFHQLRGDEYGTHTGRLSTANPNMQQIPKRDARSAAIIRKVFAHRDFEWVSGDWRQFEFRIATHYWADENLIKAYLADPDTDFHQMVAVLAGIRRDPDAKRINLGLVFGMGEGKMAYTLGLPVTVVKTPKGKPRYIPGPEAIRLFNQYHDRLPRVQPFLARAAELARERGYVRSIMGRRIRFPGGGTNKAGGLIFQSSAADMMKLCLVALWKWQRWGTKVILPVHDEFNALCPRGMVEDVVAGMKGIMEGTYAITVPIVAKVSHGRNWYEASM